MDIPSSSYRIGPTNVLIDPPCLDVNYIVIRLAPDTEYESDADLELYPYTGPDTDLDNDPESEALLQPEPYSSSNYDSDESLIPYHDMYKDNESSSEAEADSDESEDDAYSGEDDCPKFLVFYSEDPGPSHDTNQDPSDGPTPDYQVDFTLVTLDLTTLISRDSIVVIYPAHDNLPNGIKLYTAEVDCFKYEYSNHARIDKRRKQSWRLYLPKNQRIICISL